MSESVIAFNDEEAFSFDVPDVALELAGAVGKDPRVQPRFRALLRERAQAGSGASPCVFHTPNRFVEGTLVAQLAARV